MSLTLRTNRWASRIIIILHLVIWNAIAIILLQKGVNTLRKRMLETDYTIETNSSIGLSIESTITSLRRAEKYLAIVSAQDQLTDQNKKIIIRVDPESSVQNDRNYSRLKAIKNEFEITSKEQRSALFPSNPFKNSTTDGQKLRIENYRENKSSSNKTSRIARDEEYFLDDRISKNIHAKENVTGSVSKSKEEGNRDAKEKDLNSVNDVSREPKFFARENSDHQVTNSSSLRRSGSRIRFSHNSGAVTAVAMVAIGAIMLLIGPIVIILRILWTRGSKRGNCTPCLQPCGKICRQLTSKPSSRAKLQDIRRSL